MSSVTPSTSSSSSPSAGFNGLLPTVAFSGLASGINSGQIIQELLSITREPETQYNNENAVYAQQSSLLTQVETDLVNLQNAGLALEDPTLFNKTSTLTSSNPSVVTATQDGTPVPGAYTVQTGGLALDSIQQQQSSITQAANADQLTISLTNLSGVTNKTLNVNAGDSISTIAADINGLNMGVTAVVDSSGKLRLNGPGSISVTGGGLGNGYNLATDLDLAQTQAHQTASVTVNGQGYTEDTNTVSNAVPGVTLTLEQANSSATITASASAVDPTKVVTAVQNYVTAYNTAYQFMHSIITDPTVPNPQSQSDIVAGSLNNDPTLVSIMSQMRSMLSTPIAGQPSNMNVLSDIGISTGVSTGAASDSATAGTVTLDTDTLTAAITANPQAVQNMLQSTGTSAGATAGIGPNTTNMLTPFTGPTGVLATRQQTISSDEQMNSDRISQIELQVQLEQESLTKEYTAMELAISQLQSSSGSLTSVSSLLPSASSSSSSASSVG